MPDKITTLKLFDNTDVFPNIKDENIPNTIMRIADLSNYLNQLKSINITGDIDSTTITSDIATFTTADITTLNVSGVSHFEGEATFGHNVHVDGNLVVNGIDNIVDKDGNKIVKNETLDEFTKEFYDNCDVAWYMNCTLHTYTYNLVWNNYLFVPYKDKITNLASFCENASMVDPVHENPVFVIVPDIPNKVIAENMFFNARCSSITLGNITMLGANYAFSKLKGTESVVVSSGKKAKIIGNIREGFSRNSSLIEVGTFDFSEVTDAYYIFGEDVSLKSIHCTHFRVSFDISASTAFEQSDLVEIISNLDPVSTAQTLTMGSTNLAKLTQEQILVATGKGWTLA